MKALILVDIQNDFLPGGALPVKEGDRILPVVNKLLTLPFDVIVATKDYHPENHVSFAKTHNKKIGDHIHVKGIDQILWPVHCVQGTKGSEFSPEWNSDQVEEVFLKGTDPNIDSYSTFFDNAHLKSTGLEKYLRDKNVEEVYFAGLATDYCVLFSALDALKLGFTTYVIADGCEGVNLSPVDSSKALATIEEHGGKIISSKTAAEKLKNNKLS